MIATTLGLLMLAAQPPIARAAAAREPVEVDPSVVIKDILRAYRASPTADRITIAFRDPGRPVRKEEVTLRLNPLPVVGGSPIGRDFQCLAEAGPLRIYAENGYLVVVHTARPETFYRNDFEPPLTLDKLDAALRPFPFPQLALAAGSGEPGARVDLTAYARATTWSAARVIEDSERPQASAEGRSESGPVVLISDVKSGRLRKVVLTLESRGMVIDLTMAAEPAGDPARWAPSLVGRRYVGTIAELLKPEESIEVGVRFPAPAIFGPGLARLRTEDLLPPGAGARRAVLVLLRLTDGNASAVGALARAARAAFNTSMADGPAGEMTVALHVVGVLDGPGVLTEESKADADRIARRADPTLNWTLPRGASLGRVAGAVDGAVIVIDQDFVVRHLTPLSDLEADPAAAARAIVAAIRPSAGERMTEPGGEPAKEPG
ncbi:MAG: hypothetical protein ACT4PL_07440 [Phycisphaerales bacterium]